MAPTIGRVALDNGFHGSIPGDWVAPPPQNIQLQIATFSGRWGHIIRPHCAMAVIRSYAAKGSLHE